MGAGDEAPPAESIAVYTRIRSGSDGSESELSLVAGKPEVIRAQKLGVPARSLLWSNGGAV